MLVVTRARNCHALGDLTAGKQTARGWRNVAAVQTDRDCTAASSVRRHDVFKLIQGYDSNIKRAVDSLSADIATARVCHGIMVKRPRVNCEAAGLSEFAAAACRNHDTGLSFGDVSGADGSCRSVH